jgi:hypothetical protein
MSCRTSGAVAQSARAPALQAGGRGFESHQLHKSSLIYVELSSGTLY